MNRTRFLIYILFMSVFITCIKAQVPQTLSYQGVLSDANGNAVSDGSYSITFRIYDHISGGTNLWSEKQDVVVQTGVFNVNLGKVSPIDITFDRALFLGISINEDAELSPRIELSGAAYSFQALSISGGKVVKSLNGLKDDVTLEAGNNISIQKSGDKLKISSNGNGSIISPLNIEGDDDNAVIIGTNTTSNENTDEAAGVRGEYTQKGSYGLLGSKKGGVYGYNGIIGNEGFLGTVVSGVIGRSNENNVGYLGTADYGVFGQHQRDAIFNTGYLASKDYGAYGEHRNGFFGALGTGFSGVYSVNESTGLSAYLVTNNAAVFGAATQLNTLAGNFSGNVRVSGTLTKGAGSFKIDHPLDPENKYLYHSFVESPDMKNIYDGVVHLDGNGEAWVQMPEWFEALNQDFRYQLTCIGGFAQVYVAEEISGNHFKIGGGIPGMKISWQVTGIRHDAYAEANRIPIEEKKTGNEAGKYLHPQVYGAPESMGIGFQELQQMKTAKEN